jgi:hypothetical protein
LGRSKLGGGNSLVAKNTGLVLSRHNATLILGYMGDWCAVKLCRRSIARNPEIGDVITETGRVRNRHGAMRAVASVAMLASITMLPARTSTRELNPKSGKKPR